MTDTNMLTPDDPEPGIGSVVVDSLRDYWRREPSGWILMNGRGSDPESWHKVAGNYGPAQLVTEFVTIPQALTLGEVIERLKRENPSRLLPVGFAAPHSYRGDYSDLAFELRHNITVGEMLAAAESAVGATFEGWKGGDYEMRDYTDCWLVPAEGTSMGETLGALLLELMLRPR